MEGRVVGRAAGLAQSRRLQLSEPLLSFCEVVWLRSRAQGKCAHLIGNVHLDDNTVSLRLQPLSHPFLPDQLPSLCPRPLSLTPASFFACPPPLCAHIRLPRTWHALYFPSYELFKRISTGGAQEEASPGGSAGPGDLAVHACPKSKEIPRREREGESPPLDAFQLLKTVGSIALAGAAAGAIQV